MKIIGNEDVILRLKKISKLSNIPPLLFYGQKGIGKASTALYFCTLSNPREQEEKILKLIHPDVLIITNGELKPYGPRPDNFDDSKFISIEKIRFLKSELIKPPVYAKRRFVIIMDADMLTIEAQNSLLKILEEHENRTTFILITSNYLKILPTIISRTIKIPFKSLSFEEFSKYEYSWKTDIELIYNISEGSIGIAKQLNEYPIETWINFIKQVYQKRRLENFQEVLSSISNIPDFLNFLRVFRWFFNNQYRQAQSNLIEMLLLRSMEVEDVVKRHYSVEASLVNLFGLLLKAPEGTFKA